MPSNFKPRFQVVKLDGEVDHEIMAYEKQKNQKGKERPVLVRQMVKEPAGFMVYLPKGDTLRVRDEAELMRLGFGEAPELQDMESGVIMPTPDTIDLRKVNAAATNRASRSRSAATVAVQAGGDA